MKIKIEKAKISLFLFLFPFVSFAATLNDVSSKILNFFKLIPPIFASLALFYFIYGLTSYVSGVDEKQKAQAKNSIFYGVIAIFVMFSIGGIVALIRDVLGI